MENIKICPNCGQQMNLIPAGVSKKTGKNYPPFWSCSQRDGGCGYTENITAKDRQIVFSKELDKNLEDEKWQKIREQKNKDIRWMNALNNACLLIVNNKTEVFPSDIIEIIKNTANKIYRLEPEKEEPKPIKPLVNSEIYDEEPISPPDY